MSPSPTLSGYVSTKEAATSAGYSADYLARLARAGEVRGAQVGRAWFVDPVSLADYLEGQKIKKQERLNELSRTRVEEYKAHQEPAKPLTRPSRIPQTPQKARPVSIERFVRSGTPVVSPLSGLIRPSARGTRVGAAIAAFAVVASGVFVGDTPLLPRAGEQALAIAGTASGGLADLVEPLRQSVGRELAGLERGAALARTDLAGGAVVVPEEPGARSPPFVAPIHRAPFADLTSNQAVKSTHVVRGSQPKPLHLMNPLALLSWGVEGFVTGVHELIGGEVSLAYAVPTTVAPGVANGATWAAGEVGTAMLAFTEEISHTLHSAGKDALATPIALASDTGHAIGAIHLRPVITTLGRSATGLQEATVLAYAGTSEGITAAATASTVALGRAKNTLQSIVSSARKQEPRASQPQTAAVANAASASTSTSPRPTPGPQTFPVVVSVPVSGQTISYGDLIAYDPSTGRYTAAQGTNSSVVGIAVENPPVLLSSGAPLGGVPIVRSGRALVNVTLENGAIAPGDSIAASSLSGKAMKAAPGATGAIGIAREAFSGGEASSTTVVAHGTSVSVGTIVVDVNAALGEAPGVGQCAGGSILCTLASKVNATPLVSLLRYLVAAAVALGSLFLAFRTFMADAVSGVISVGRNPRAKTAIQAMVIFNGVLAVGIALAGLVAGLIILFIKI